ncbi:MAG: hypothetical protein M3Q78_00375 [Acidobacteriota bacterium]|nr:hypothetical protein [Acidobacteriota bacterium]
MAKLQRRAYLSLTLDIYEHRRRNFQLEFAVGVPKNSGYEEQYASPFSFMRRFSEEIIWGCYEKRRHKYDSGKSRYVKRHG